MLSTLPALIRFHVLRMLRLQPAALLCLVLLLAVNLIAAAAYLFQWKEASSAQQMVRELQASSRQMPPAESSQVSREDNGVALPAFHGAQLVSSLNQLAADSHLPLDEVLYNLDESANQPYLRYQVTLSTTAPYPVIRHFSVRMSRQMNNVILDSISCSRDDIGVRDLSCDLVFSAFYRKDSRG